MVNHWIYGVPDSETRSVVQEIITRSIICAMRWGKTGNCPKYFTGTVVFLHFTYHGHDKAIAWFFNIMFDRRAEHNIMFAMPGVVRTSFSSQFMHLPFQSYHQHCLNFQHFSLSTAFKNFEFDFSYSATRPEWPTWRKETWVFIQDLYISFVQNVPEVQGLSTLWNRDIRTVFRSSRTIFQTLFDM